MEECGQSSRLDLGQKCMYQSISPVIQIWCIKFGLPHSLSSLWHLVTFILLLFSFSRNSSSFICILLCICLLWLGSLPSPLHWHWQLCFYQLWHHAGLGTNLLIFKVQQDGMKSSQMSHCWFHMERLVSIIVAEHIQIFRLPGAKHISHSFLSFIHSSTCSSTQQMTVDPGKMLRIGRYTWEPSINLSFVLMKLAVSWDRQTFVK